jgi:hypothetical protein
VSTLHGKIEPGTVGNIMQYLALSQADGRLTVINRGAQQGNVYFEAGLVVCIEARPFRDLAALSAMLAWEGGSFVFKRDVVPPRRTMSQQVELLLLQVSRRPAAHGHSPVHLQLGRDAVLAAASGEGAFQLSDDQFYADAGGEVLLSLGALHLWRKLDGANSLGQIALASDRPVEDVVAAAHELLEHDLADYVSLRVADPRFAEELKREAIDLLGPVGEVVIEDAFIELGLVPESLPVSSVDELFAELGNSFPWRSRNEFMRRAAALRVMFALDAAQVGRSVER